MTFNPTIDAVKELDGRIFAMLDDAECEVLNFYRTQGRKFGVKVSIVNAGDSDVLKRAESRWQVDQILKSTNSVISVSIDG